MTRKPLAKLRASLLASQSQPVSLVVAAALVYHQVQGKTQRMPGYRRTLESTAHAISQVADIYYVNAQNRLARIPDEDLAAGAFEDGGETFRAAAQVYTQLSVRRADLMDAIEILQNAHQAIGKAASSGVQHSDTQKD